MNANENSYPVFEANQVLTNAHLNQAFDYLNEQERLTRANLIGIGIACGLKVRLEPAIPTIKISKGCGVTSAGCKEYPLPDSLPYPSFTKDPTTPGSPQLEMWELFPADDPDTTPLTSDFLSGKVVVLFVELKKDNLRNCSPNNCDDKGAAVTVTLRKLLMYQTQAGAIITATRDFEKRSSVDDLTTDLTKRLGLPDLVLPRYDVPNSSPVTSQDVLRGFYNALHSTSLAGATKQALSLAYEAFKPVVQDRYPSDPFSLFPNSFGFLDDIPKSHQQVRFLQYYYDFFGDLIGAYNEFRWKGIELMCACCPPAGLFPRHLFAGVVTPPDIPDYRQEFIPSSTIGHCETLKKEVQSLFQRFVEMAIQFTDNPPLPPRIQDNRTDNQIKITPSKFGDVPASAKSIPYYYKENGTPPIYQLWDPGKTARQRSKQNLSYQAYQYATDPFVRNPLDYDLEPTAFFRIEGHLGKNYGGVLQTLQDVKTENRLPIEIVAVRTGAFDRNLKIELDKEECHFQDLDLLYKTEREKLHCLISRVLILLYTIKQEYGSPVTKQTKSLFPLINEYYPNFLVSPNTLGRIYEDASQGLPGKQVITGASFLTEKRYAFFNFIPTAFEVIRILFMIAESVTEGLSEFDFAEFQILCARLDKVVEFLKANRTPSNPDSNESPNWEVTDKLLDDILSLCRGRVLKTLVDEFARRVREVQQKQFLSFFLQKNPGIQHKAGVPMGGTFVVVYHDPPAPLTEPDDSKAIPDKKTLWTMIPPDARTQMTKAYLSLRNNPYIAADYNFQLFTKGFSGNVEAPKQPPPASPLDQILNETVDKLQPGTVIADFFLPYICCSDCAPIQFVINNGEPKVDRPTFSVTSGCTGDSDSLVTIVSKGGTAPYYVRVKDDLPFEDFKSPIVLQQGNYSITIKDKNGVLSVSQPLTIPERMSIIGQIKYINNYPTWRVQFTFAGGTPKYQSSDGDIVKTGNEYTFTSKSTDESTMPVEIVDAAGCKIAQSFTHSVLPCGGIARRCAYRFWLPLSQNSLYRPETISIENFSFTGADNKQVSIKDDAGRILSSIDWPKATAKSVGQALTNLNDVIAKGATDSNFLKLSYAADETNPFGMLIIEYYDCLGFNLKINSTLRVGKLPEQLTINYDKTGAQFIWVRRTVPSNAFYPPFRCFEVNRLTPGPDKPMFKETDLKLKITPTVRGSIVDLSTPDLGDKTVYAWESDDGIPAISGGPKTMITFPSPGKKTIRLTVIKAGVKYVEQVVVPVSGARPRRGPIR
jgi:hypothetical protein